MRIVDRDHDKGPNVPSPQRPCRVGVFLTPDFTLMTAGLLLDPMSIANWLCDRPVFEWRTLSVDGDPVRASNGVPAPVDRSLAEAGELDTVFVVAGFDAKRLSASEETLKWLRRQARFGVEVGGVEAGAEILAAAGLLDGVVASVHWDNLTGFRERYPGVLASPRLYALSPGRPTCAGGAAAGDMMLRWIERRIGARDGERLRKMLLHAPVRSADALPEDRNLAAPSTRSQALGRAVAAMADSLETPLALSEIARRAEVARRTMERAFRRETGMSPLEYYRALRLREAHRLLQQTDLPVTEIAVAVGYSSPEHFSRAYKRLFKVTPRSDRAQVMDAPVSPI
ncbi:MAG: GlxA family transcriptional regulator [Marivibrio sp.]|uniref:GlxA family transcriptional regulator n=1 Tax=Marivibrio sp. TaxID=2039719 RepID=UPI0032EE8C8B